jgi:hypothetical protein
MHHKAEEKPNAQNKEHQAGSFGPMGLGGGLIHRWGFRIRRRSPRFNQWHKFASSS